MDPTEDLSPRVLLRRILITEPPQTPVVRSVPKTQGTVPFRRSSRLSDAAAKTPQDILRRSLRYKMRESITRKSLPAAKRRTVSVALRQTHTPAPTSMLFDDADTPRHILMNILQTEPVRSPVVHTQAESEEPQSSSANSSVASKRPSIELSGLDLPDLTIGNAASTAKGLSRKRPRRSLNVTAFEKRLKDGDDIEEENERSIGDHSSLSLSSSSSLSLKTPFVDVRTEKRGLQRKVSNRRKITEESFGAAVNKRHIGEASSSVEQGPSETAYSEGFTLGLSKLSEPDITTDIVHCNTALYAQPDAMTSNFSIVATQEKPTVMASQLQTQILEMGKELMEAEHSKLVKERSVYLLPTEEGVVAEAQIEERFSLAAETYKEMGKSTAEGQPEDAAAMLKLGEEEGTVECQNNVGDDAAKSEQENRLEVQTEEDIQADSQNEEDGVVDYPTEDDEEGEVDFQPEENAARSQSDEEEVAPDSQTEEDGAVDSPTEDDEEGEVDFQPEENAARSQSDEEEVAPDSQTEEDGAVDSPVEEGEESEVHFQPEDGAAANSQSDEEEVAPDPQIEEEDGAVDSQTGEFADVDSQSEVEEDVTESHIDQENAEGGFADSQAEDDHDKEEEGDEQVSEQLERDVEHVSRRAHGSGSGVVPVGEAESGWSDGKSKAQGTFDVHNSLEMGSQKSNHSDLGIPDLTEASTRGQKDASKSDADKENSFHASVEDGGHLSDESPEEAAAQDPAVQEEGWEDEDGEESEEVPSKTPAFVREKRKIFHPDPQALPALQKEQASTSDNLPVPKRKQMRKRSRPATKEGGLPKSYLMKVFKHFAKTKVSADVYPVLKEIMDKFFARLAEDLETYALHAKRKTIEVEDVELLLKRQGHVNDKVPVEVLIEKYLRMDQRKLLIPIATSGNVVTPMSRR